MNVTTILLDLINGYKTYSAAILTIATGVGAILSKNYSQGLTDILQALTLIFGGASVVGLRHAVAKVPTGVLKAAGHHD
jgi:multidrug transporter EmrE-like cation transporter